MQAKTNRTLEAFSIFFLAHWFFGNLYEEIVLVPNQLTNTYEALRSWQNYFTISNPIFYYVPFTQLAVVFVWILYFTANDADAKKKLGKASLTGLLAIVLTFLIVTQLNLKLFFGDITKYKDDLYNLSILWLIGNGVRICLVGATLYFVFQVFILNRIIINVKQ